MCYFAFLSLPKMEFDKVQTIYERYQNPRSLSWHNPGMVKSTFIVISSERWGPHICLESLHEILNSLKMKKRSRDTSIYVDEEGLVQYNYSYVCLFCVHTLVVGKYKHLYFLFFSM